MATAPEAEPAPSPEEDEATDRKAAGIVVHRDDGAPIHVELHGSEDAPAILILDGIGCSGWAFRRVIPRLTQSYRVLLMHYRGHGRSPNPPRPWRIGLHVLADDAAATLRACQVQDAVVVGFSMGFQVALELYRRHRPMVRGLVSLAGPSGRALAQFQGTELVGHVLPLVRMAAHHATDFTGQIWRKVLPSKWLQTFGLATQLNRERIDMADIELYLNQMAKMSPELFLDMLGEAQRHCADDVLPDIRVPSLIMAGAGDRFIPIDVMRRMAFAIPGAQWVVMGDATHALPAEFGPEIAERILRFYAEVDPPAPDDESAGDDHDE